MYSKLTNDTHMTSMKFAQFSRPPIPQQKQMQIKQANKKPRTFGTVNKKP